MFGLDGDEFDRMTLRLSRRRARRAAVLALAAALAGALGLRQHDAMGQECPVSCADGEACVGGQCLRTCQTHRDCRSKKHDDPCIANTCVDGVCLQAIVDCDPAHVCCRGECCPRTCTSDDECSTLDPCRTARCGTGGVCEVTELDQCVTCQSAADCADQGANVVCCNGSCKRPCPVGTVMGKGCECGADGSADSGLIVRDDASG